MNIEIDVRNKIATSPDDALIICGNSDYTMTFIFDEEWDAELHKTARLVWHVRGKTFRRDIPLDGNKINVPVLANVHAVFVGVYAGDLKTTTRAKVPCEPCILCGDEDDDESGDSLIIAQMQCQIRKLLAEQPNLVFCTEQFLTTEQKSQARTNIGAATVEDVLDAIPVWTGGAW